MVLKTGKNVIFCNYSSKFDQTGACVQGHLCWLLYTLYPRTAITVESGRKLSTNCFSADGMTVYGNMEEVYKSLKNCGYHSYIWEIFVTREAKCRRAAFWRMRVRSTQRLALSVRSLAESRSSSTVWRNPRWLALDRLSWCWSSVWEW